MTELMHGGETKIRRKEEPWTQILLLHSWTFFTCILTAWLPQGKWSTVFSPCSLFVHLLYFCYQYFAFYYCYQFWAIKTNTKHHTQWIPIFHQFKEMKISAPAHFSPPSYITTSLNFQFITPLLLPEHFTTFATYMYSLQWDTLFFLL